MGVTAYVGVVEYVTLIIRPCCCLLMELLDQSCVDKHLGVGLTEKDSCKYVVFMESVYCNQRANSTVFREKPFCFSNSDELFITTTHRETLICNNNGKSI